MTNPRTHWHARATNLVQLDCSLLELVPDDDRDLAKLRSDVYALVLKKLDALASEACRMEADGLPERHIECELAKAIWNFIKPWKGSTNVPRETYNPERSTPCSS